MLLLLIQNADWRDSRRAEDSDRFSWKKATGLLAACEKTALNWGTGLMIPNAAKHCGVAKSPIVCSLCWFFWDNNAAALISITERRRRELSQSSFTLVSPPSASSSSWEERALSQCLHKPWPPTAGLAHICWITVISKLFISEAVRRWAPFVLVCIVETKKGIKPSTLVTQG